MGPVRRVSLTRQLRRTNGMASTIMPHVRTKEYKKPGFEYELQYVEVIQRHNKRTPYGSNTFFQEDVTWDCTGHGPYGHAKSTVEPRSTPVYWQVDRDNVNPFRHTIGPGFAGSTCLFPGITPEGLSDSYEHGVDFGGVYRHVLDFLPMPSNQDAYRWRVTHNAITSQTLGAFARGLYPEVEEYSAYMEPAEYDSLEPRFRCPLASRVQAENEGRGTVWEAHLRQTSALRKRFFTIAGIEENESAGWSASWDHPFDNLQAKQCHQKPLPCSVNDTSHCLSQADADTIYRLGNWEYAYRWRGTPKSLLLSSLKMTPWIQELRSHLRASAAATSKTQYIHNFGHDGSIGALLGVLQVEKPVWPGLASEVVFELWRKGQEHFVRVLFSGQPLVTSTPLGVLDMVSLKKLDEYFDSVLLPDIVSVCNA